MALQQARVSLLRGSCLVQIGARTIASKAMRIREDKPKPFPYEKRQYNYIDPIFDKTTTRFDENSKLIIVEGAHAIGKTQFAKELAEEFEMKYVGYPRIEDLTVNCYGDDFRKYHDAFPQTFQIYDEKDFSRNPLGPIEGGSDSMHCIIFREKFRNYLDALRHIFNTGQGVVMEGSPYSDYAYFNAAYKQGWIDDPGTKKFYLGAKELSIDSNSILMRPNLIIYLDAPVDVVQKKIQARNNEWDKDSPVWTNKQYLNDIYNEFKKRFLPAQEKHSYVLVYDWSEPGDTEVVVEDIEALNFDRLPKHEEQQADWRLGMEKEYADKRFKYSNQNMRDWYFSSLILKHSFEGKHLVVETEENREADQLLSYIKSFRYAAGMNPFFEDKMKLMFSPFKYPRYPYSETECKWIRPRTYFRLQGPDGI